MRRANLVLLLLAAALACGQVRRFAYSGPGRDDWQQPERVMEALALAPGARVADLGAGGGYFTFRLADAVGPTGRVYAVDVDPDMTSFIEQQAREKQRTNVSVVLAPTDDPKLPEPVDLIFTVDTWHHLPDHAAYFRRAAAYLRPGGRVAVVEYKQYGLFQRWLGHWTPAADIVRDMQAAGYTLAADHDFLERQSFLVFGRPTP